MDSFWNYLYFAKTAHLCATNCNIDKNAFFRLNPNQNDKKALITTNSRFNGKIRIQLIKRTISAVGPICFISTGETILYTGILDPGMLLASSMNKRTIVYCLLVDMSVPMFNQIRNHDPGMRSRKKSRNDGFKMISNWFIYF